MSQYLHISDLHLHANADDNAEMAKCIAEMAANSGTDDRLVVSGDITDGGTEDEYREAARILAPWTGRLYACVGNHDEDHLGLFWYLAAAKRWAKFCEQLSLKPVNRTSRCLIYCLDTTRHTIWDLARGRVGISQRLKLAKYVDEAKNAGLHFDVVMHHSILDHSPLELLEDAAEVRRLIIGKARYVFCGHEHVHREWGSGGTMVIAADSFRDCLKPLVWEM